MENHKPTSFFSGFLLVVSFNAFLSFSQHLPIASEGDANQVQTYIVHVQRPEHHEFLGDEDHEAWHKSFLPNTTLDSDEARLIYSYRYAISGFAARLTPLEAEAMKSKEGFIRANPSRKLFPRTTYTPHFLGLSRWDGLWVDSFMGNGIIIGVLDYGITPENPSFHDDGTMPPPPPQWKWRCGFRNKSLCNNKLIGAMAFKGGRTPSPRDPRKKGHGTHVAGIAAGSFVDNAEVLGLARGTASGTAPKAHLVSYRVCYPKSSCANSDILAAINQAVKDGVDVLSFSIGREASAFYNDDMAIGAFSAAKNGTIVCMCAGNSGPSISSIENDAPWVLTVGASTHDRRAKAIVKLGDGTELEGESGYQPRDFLTTLPLVFPGFDGQNGTEGCSKDSFDNIDVKNKIVICWVAVQGTFKDMSVNVKKAGGAAVIIGNTFVEGFTTFSDDHVLPTAHLDIFGLRKIINYIQSNPAPTATIYYNGTRFGARPSPTIAFFSSRGPSKVNGGILKPDIVGPGVNILSAWPVKPGPKSKSPSLPYYYNFLSGTSMSTPHLAGVAALLRSTHKSWSPSAIKSAIMTTADRLDRDMKPIVDDYDDVRNPADLFSMGSGQVNPHAANDPGLVYDIKPFEYIRYLCGLGYSDKDVTTFAGRSIKCANVANISSENLNYPSISVTLDPNVTKTITRQLTSVVDDTEVYYVTIEEPNGISVNVTPAKLRFSKLDQKRRYTVEFRVKGTPLAKGESLGGQLLWISRKHEVRSPISATFA